MARFKFDREKQLMVGVERECFLLDKDGKPVPRVVEVLDTVYSDEPVGGNYWSGTPQYGWSDNIGYELSACQIENRTDACHLNQLRDNLLVYDKALRRCAKKHGLTCGHYEVGPEDMPLDVYPSPRYLKIVKTMPRHILSAACRVIGTHVHIGMPDHETALRVYNKVISYTEELSKMGDGSRGERLKIYKIMAPDSQPSRYDSWEDFHQAALAKNFVSDPRRCWTLIRISVHGTIEFRMFGTTPDLDKIIGWAKRCHELCLEAMV